MSATASSRDGEGKFFPGFTPWNNGVKGYRNTKNSSLRTDKTNPLFSNSIRPRYSSCGVYAIINRSNGRIYVGSSIKLGGRLARHRDNVSKKRDVHNRLISAMVADPCAFEFSVLEETKTRKEAYEREQFWMNFYQSYIPEFGYNNAPKSTTPKGSSHAIEIRIAKSVRQTGKKRTASK